MDCHATWCNVCIFVAIWLKSPLRKCSVRITPQQSSSSSYTFSGYSGATRMPSIISQANQIGSWLTVEAWLTLTSLLARRRETAWTSSFFAATCRAGRRPFPPESRSSNSETTASWQSCKATARGVKPSCTRKIRSSHANFLVIFSYLYAYVLQLMPAYPRIEELHF